MTLFIAIAIPETAAGLFESVVPPPRRPAPPSGSDCSQWDLGARPCSNPFLRRMFGRGYKAYWLVEQVTGDSRRLFHESAEDEEPEESVEERITRQGRRKGWSDAKIRRAAEESRQARGDDGDRDWGAGLRRDVRELLARLAREFGRVGFVLHEFEGLVENERFGIIDGDTITPSAILDEDHAIAPDTFVWIRD